MQRQDAEVRFALPKTSGRTERRGYTALVRPLPRISRLMALAIQLQRRVDDNEFDYGDLAQLGRISRPRLTQIFNLLNLAPDLQEELLFLESGSTGRERLTEKALRRLGGMWSWDEQRRAFKAIVDTRPHDSRKHSELQ